MERNVYTFQKNNGRTVEFGPYADEDEAKDAFQRRYGYWPSDALDVQVWESHRPVMFGNRRVCSCGDFNCASLDALT